MRKIILLILSISFVCIGDVYWVSPTGAATWANAKSSTQLTGTAATTLATACTNAAAGDIVYINDGTYNGRFAPTNSGTDGNLITFKAYSSGAIVRYFNLSAKNYIRLVGINFYHNNYSTLLSYAAITCEGSIGCEIIDNYIDSTFAGGIDGYTNGSSSDFNLIKGNRLAYTGTCKQCGPNGTSDTSRGAYSIMIEGDHNRIEYNDISHTEDFTEVWGDSNIIRNNYFHDCLYSDNPEWNAEAPEGYHLDGMQTYSSATHATLRYTVMEANFMTITQTMSNNHFFIIRDDLARLGSRDFIFRRNVAYLTGGMIAIAQNCPGVRLANNSFIDMQQHVDAINGTALSIDDMLDTLPGVPWVSIINNIFYNAMRKTPGVPYNANSSGEQDYNLAYLSGTLTETHGLADVNPLLTSYATGNLHLSDSSPCVDTGGPLTLVRANGESTKIPVDDAGFFNNGFGITEGDSIKIGSEKVVVESIDYDDDTITANRSIAFSDNDPVYLLPFNGTKPDIGAYEYNSNGYAYSVSVDTADAGSSTTAITATVRNPGQVRYVTFYGNGIPLGTDYYSPYTVTVPDTSISWNYEARAYPLNASSTLWSSSNDFVSHSINITIRR